MKGNQKERSRGRPALTKGQLLPLSTAKVRSFSLENHLALATVRAGRGGLDQLCCLLRVVYLAFYLRDEVVPETTTELCRRAKAALHACIARVERDEPCLLLNQEQAVIERVLVLYDEQLAAVSRRRYLTAWEQLQRFIVGGKRSPIPVPATV